MTDSSKLPDPGQLMESIQSAQRGAKKSEDVLPPIATFHLDVVGDHGKRWTGTFVYEVPKLGAQVLIGRLKAEYLPSGSAADLNAASLTEAICYLQVTLQADSLPDWWKPMELYDATPVVALYEKARDYERRFRGDFADEQGDTQSDQAEKESGRSGNDGEATVGRKVRPPAQRRQVVLADTSRSD